MEKIKLENFTTKITSYWLTKDNKVVSVSNKANVQRELKVRIIRGYPQVKIGNCWLLVHRIIAKVRIPNPENKPYVNHKNGIKSDNRVRNLEWVTPLENARHAVKTGLIPAGEACHNAKLKNKDIAKIKKLYSKGKKTQREIGDMFGIGNDIISRIINKKRWQNI